MRAFGPLGARHYGGVLGITNFIVKLEVTTRTPDNVDSTTTVNLTADTWIEVTAADLGVEGVELKAIWFNAPGVSVPNNGKFGLDDFTVTPE